MSRNMMYSTAGLTMTKEFEGLSLKSYKDVAGILTVGYGHAAADVHVDQQITEVEAAAFLRADLWVAEACVNKVVQQDISQSQFDALVDFCFNVGRGNFLQSSLLRYVNQGEFANAAEQFLLWVNVGGKRCEGLVRRRTAERALFLTGCSETTRAVLQHPSQSTSR